MRLSARFVVLLFGILLTQKAASAEFRFGSLWMQWPEGFSTKSTQPPFELVGPRGVVVLVTVVRRNPQATATDRAPNQQELGAFAERLMLRQGEKAGKVVVSFKRSSLPDGSDFLLLGSETGGFFGSGFFLQYAVISPAGRMAFFTIEGKGQPEAENAKYELFFQSAKWEE